jgi:hypothetical protein
VQRAPGIPHALYWARYKKQRLGRIAPRDLYACLEFVIASAAKQSILSLRGEMDCFAALAMTVLATELSWLFENFDPSCPDLIRASITLRNKFFVEDGSPGQAR